MRISQEQKGKYTSAVSTSDLSSSDVSTVLTGFDFAVRIQVSTTRFPSVPITRQPDKRFRMTAFPGVESNHAATVQGKKTRVPLVEAAKHGFSWPKP